MHVVMVAERLPPAIGGVERHVGGLVPLLIGEGISVTLVTVAHEPGLATRENVWGATVLRMPPARGKRRALQAWRWWAHRRSLLRADVVHFHGVYSLFHLVGPWLGVIPKHKRFLTYHGYHMRWPVPWKEKAYHRLADRLTQGSISVGHFLVELFGIHPRAITYGACTLPPSPPPHPATRKALFLGRLDEDTGIETVMEAFGLLPEPSRVPLVVCGDGPLRQRAEGLARARGVVARFVGFTSEPGPYLDEASVVCTSGYLGILEAMARRRPVCAVAHNPVKRLYLQIPHAPLYRAHDATELAGHLAQLLDRGAPAPVLEEGYRFAAAHSWERLLRTYLDLWGL